MNKDEITETLKGLFPSTAEAARQMGVHESLLRQYKNGSQKVSSRAISQLRYIKAYKQIELELNALKNYFGLDLNVDIREFLSKLKEGDETKLQAIAREVLNGK